ncbi:hypothetical protein M501DRAFT_915718, partial [Patellaria atrata CBS 101060]
MPTLELTSLSLLPPTTATTPTLLPVLRTVRTALQTNSHFYTCLDDPSKLYILGHWASLSAHQDFLSSSSAASILEPQEDLLEFNWGIHIPLSPSAQLPLSAPVIALTRLFIQPARVAEFVAKLPHVVDVLAAASRYPVLAAWREDAEEGRPECVVISGWESPEGHTEFTVRAIGEDVEYASVQKCLTGLEVRHLRDLE